MFYLETIRLQIMYLIYEGHTISFQTFFEWAFKIVVDSWKFSMLLLYILWDDWPTFMISGSNEQLLQQLEYTQLKSRLSQLVNFKNAIWQFYAIKLCFKFGKNATEMYGMLLTAFGASCMNQAWVFEWHKKFKEVRESVRDDERCGRIKEVRTPELIGQRVRVWAFPPEQYTSPQLHPCHRLFDQDGHQHSSSASL